MCVVILRHQHYNAIVSSQTHVLLITPVQREVTVAEDLFKERERKANEKERKATPESFLSLS